MSLEQILENLSGDIKIAAIPQKDRKGSYQFNINQETQVSITELDPGAFFFVKIMAMPESKSKEALFIYLMKANLLGQGTGGSVIGIDPLEKHLTLSLSLPFDLNYKIFREHLEDFLNYCDYWKKEIPSFLASILD